MSADLAAIAARLAAEIATVNDEILETVSRRDALLEDVAAHVCLMELIWGSAVDIAGLDHQAEGMAQRGMNGQPRAAVPSVLRPIARYLRERQEILDELEYELEHQQYLMLAIDILVEIVARTKVVPDWSFSGCSLRAAGPRARS